jgi:peptide/nickel transport system substrate-binding protein
MVMTSRRSFVKGAAAAGAAAAFGGSMPFVSRALAQAARPVVYLQTEPLTSSWDVSSHTSLSQIYLEHHVFGKLIQTPMRPGNTEEIVYDLATSQKVLPEEGAIEYTLREDVYFHDGKKFGPEDVKATFEYASDPSRPAATWYPGQAEVEVVDARTVRVRGANGAYPGSLFYFLAGFLPIMSAEDIRSGAIAERPNGTGYFKFASREGQTTRLVANEQYYAGAPQIKEHHMTYVGDGNTRLLSLLNGEADLIEGIEPEQYETLLNENVTIQRTVSTGNNYLHFRKRAPFDDVRVRHAAAHAINRDDLVELMGAAGHKSVGQLSPAKFGYAETIPGSPEYDPERCQQLLAEAGYPGGAGLPEIDFLVSVGLYPKSKEVCELIGAQLQEQGFPVTLTVMEVAAWLEKIFDKSETASHLAHTGWLTGSPEPNLVLRPMWHSSGGLFTNITTSEIDGLIDKQQNIVDPDERRTSIQTELLPALARELPTLGLFTGVLIHAHDPELQGLYIYPNGLMDLAKANWSA